MFKHIDDRGFLMTRSEVICDCGADKSTIAIIDERIFYCECLIESLAASLECDVTREASVEACASRATSIGLFILYSDNALNARKKCERLAKFAANVPIIIISQSEDPEFVFSAIKSGAKGVIPTSMTLETAIAAIEFVIAGGVFVPANCLLNSEVDQGWHTLPLMNLSHALLTARQAQIVESLRQGKANKVIAHELNMCESTVKTHIRKIMRKLNASNRTEVAYLANKIDLRPISHPLMGESWGD